MARLRLKAHIRVSAHVRRAAAGGAFAAVVRRGDPDAGAVAVKVFFASGAPPEKRAQVYNETRGEDGAPVWRDPLGGPTDEAAVDAWLAKETDFDPDLWIIEIEDKDGRAFLE